MKCKLTVKELLDAKGKRKFSMTNAGDADTARAAELAGIDIIGGRGGDTVEKMCSMLDRLRQAVPNTLLACNLPATIAYVSNEAAEIECVPERIAAEVTKGVDILAISLGSGRHCDGQFLYSCDLLGTYEGRYPRHVKILRFVRRVR